ncbi:hypothetical protein BU23DRAFT_574318 [Bimuria novae-zelandiae CBS 107.79]|uniref:Uncharacterized protein n=1 Tax=Bimuria novae-zelandiae CBS 107.79 TaxID=1447943 RepID=A0A6A5UQN0_9PLEO|nr:hypothetical protein BU23DRAFT_574318 [Bimuria novae-zelandiae CBS 107.79]
MSYKTAPGFEPTLLRSDSLSERMGFEEIYWNASVDSQVALTTQLRPGIQAQKPHYGSYQLHQSHEDRSRQQFRLRYRLHAFLTAFHAKLQQEIRDGCYAHLFDEDTIASLLHYGAPSLHSLNGNNEISRASLSRGPRFLEEAIVPSCISRETVKTFFSTFNGLSVLTDDPRNFTYLLNDDIFSCGVTAGDMRIQALHLRYSLDKLDKNLPFMTEHELLATSLAPFPSPTFKAANEFRLTITLIRNYGSMQGQSSLIISDIGFAIANTPQLRTQSLCLLSSPTSPSPSSSSSSSTVPQTHAAPSRPLISQSISTTSTS